VPTKCLGYSEVELSHQSRKILVIDLTKRILLLKFVKEFGAGVRRKSGDVTVIDFHECKFPYEAQVLKMSNPRLKGETDNEIYLRGYPVHDRDGNGLLQVL
jgi:hypothetical protein